MKIILGSVNMKSSSILLPYDKIKEFVLSKYNLQDSKLEQIKFKDTEKQRAVYCVSSPTQKYCLKKVYYKKEDLLFVYSATEWLYRYNIKVTRVLPTCDNMRFVSYNNMIFILMPWITGRKFNYDDINDILKASTNLALMHKCSSKFFPIESSSVRNGFDRIDLSTKKHFEQILDFCNAAYKINDDFSKVLLSNSESCISLAKKALEASSFINMGNLRKSLCHLDYVNKNIIFDNLDNIWIIDFDNCKMDFCAHDISYFLRRILKRDSTVWNNEILINTLNSYEYVKNLNLDEYLYILSYLAFPQKYWKICRDYYKNIRKCNKNSFINLLKDSIKYNREQLEFTKNFANYINGKFNVDLKYSN